MAKSAGIKKVSPRHNAILNHILANPTQKLGEVAALFRVTPEWLSTVIHSHAFQDLLRSRQDEIFESTLLGDVGEKVMAAAHMTLDKYMEKVPHLSADQLISSQDKLLGRLGFGTKNGKMVVEGDLNIQQNNVRVSADILEEARNRIGTHKVGEADSQAALPDPSAQQGTEVEGVVVRTGGASETT